MRPKSTYRKWEYENQKAMTVWKSKVAATNDYTQKAHRLNELESQIDNAVIQYNVANTQLETLKKSQAESDFNFHEFQCLYHKALEGQLTAIKKQEMTKEYEQKINQIINNKPISFNNEVNISQLIKSLEEECKRLEQKIDELMGNKTKINMEIEKNKIKQAKMTESKINEINKVILSEERQCPLINAAEKGDFNFVKQYYEEEIHDSENRQTQLDQSDDNGETALHKASREGHAQIVHFLLEYGANLEIKSRDGYTPLHWAAKSGDLKILIMLLEDGADINSKGQYQRTPLHMATHNNRYHCVNHLLAQPDIHIDSQTDEKDHLLSPLMIAAMYGFLELVKLLVNAGANLTLRSEEGDTALVHAIYSGYHKSVNFLLQSGAKFDCSGKHTFPALLEHSKKKNSTDVIDILENYAQNHFNNESTLLHPKNKDSTSIKNGEIHKTVSILLDNLNQQLSCKTTLKGIEILNSIKLLYDNEQRYTLPHDLVTGIIQLTTKAAKVLKGLPINKLQDIYLKGLKLTNKASLPNQQVALYILLGKTYLADDRVQVHDTEYENIKLAVNYFSHARQVAYFLKEEKSKEIDQVSNLIPTIQYINTLIQYVIVRWVLPNTLQNFNKLLTDIYLSLTIEMGKSSFISNMEVFEYEAIVLEAKQKADLLKNQGKDTQSETLINLLNQDCLRRYKILTQRAFQLTQDLIATGQIKEAKDIYRILHANLPKIESDFAIRLVSLNNQIQMSETRNTDNTNSPINFYEKLYNLRKHKLKNITNNYEKNQNNPGRINRLQLSLVKNLINFTRELIEECLIWLVPNRDSFLLGLMGSFATATASIFSDLEILALIADDKYRKYVEELLKLFELNVVALGETEHRDCPNSQINKSIIKGFRIDSGGYPLYEQVLIALPEDMARMQSANHAYKKIDESEFSTNTPVATARTCTFFYGNKVLGTDYQKSLSIITKDFIAEKQSFLMIEKRVKDYRRIKPLGIDSQFIDIKKRFFPFIYLLIDIGYRKSLNTKYPFAILNLLKNHNFFSKKYTDTAKRALADIYRIRLKIHMTAGYQKEKINFSELDKNDQKALMCAEWAVIRPLIEAFTDWVNNNGKNDEILFDSPNRLLKHPKGLLESKLDVFQLKYCFKMYLFSLFARNSKVSHYTSTLRRLPESLWLMFLESTAELYSLYPIQMKSIYKALYNHPHKDGTRFSYIEEYDQWNQVLMNITEEYQPQIKNRVGVHWIFKNRLIKRLLKVKYHSYLFDKAYQFDPDKRVNEFGRRTVIAVKDIAYFKVFPELGMQFPVDLFTYHFCGYSSFSTLCHFIPLNAPGTSYPVLISRPAGQDLQTYINNDDIIKISFDRYTDTLVKILKWLLLFGDDKGDNVGLEEKEDQPGVYRSTSFDSDHVLVPPILYNNEEELLNLKTVSFCYSMFDKLDKEAVSIARYFNPFLFLKTWLEILQTYHKVLMGPNRNNFLFTQDDIGRFAQDKNMCSSEPETTNKSVSFLPIVFEQGSVAMLLKRFLHLQKELSQPVKHMMALLNRLDPQLASHYETVNHEYLGLVARFNNLRTNYRQEIIQGEPLQQASMNPSAVLEKSTKQKRTLTLMSQQAGIYEAIANETYFNLNDTLKELRLTYQHYTNMKKIFNRLEEGDIYFAKFVEADFIKEKLINKLEFSKFKTPNGSPDFKMQKIILSTFYGTSFQHLQLTACESLDERILNLLITNSPGLQILDVSKCRNISDSAIRSIFSKSPHLVSLNISGTKVKHIKSAYTGSPLKAPQLKKFFLKNCEELETISLIAPHLERINAKNSRKLKKIYIDSNYIKHYNFTNSPVEINTRIAQHLGLSVAILSRQRDNEFIQFCIQISSNTIQEKHLNLSRKNINGLQLRAFSIALYNNKYITQLNLSHNGIKDDLFHLSYSLRENRSVTLLNLSYNGITGNQFDQFCQVFATHPNLRVINLQHNSINSKGVSILAYYLKFASSEKIIYLDGNPAIETSAARELLTTFKQNKNIKKITMCGVKSTDHYVRLSFEQLNSRRSKKPSRKISVNQNPDRNSPRQIRIQIQAHGDVALFSNQNKKNNKTEKIAIQSSTKMPRQLRYSTG